MFHRGESTIRYTCGTAVAAVVMMAATSVAGPGFSLQQISVPGGGGIGPIPWGNGGTYEGLGDTVPPGIGEHTIAPGPVDWANYLATIQIDWKYRLGDDTPWSLSLGLRDI
jgi:hypothetical protein